MLLEAENYLPNQLLRDTDQMSMAHSIEVRVPLLDDSVVRVIDEIFREPDAGVNPLFGLSRGTFYSLFLIVGGLALLFAPTAPLPETPARPGTEQIKTPAPRS